ncbi:hypothetical protein GCM10010411_08950 [Actinomadura fulvescens]|uniref:Uncharacterized protein n=1 Tax=Actinomadura fulvescens TaxID=46160 RepID=A0ABN3PCA5_9ACTN
MDEPFRLVEVDVDAVGEHDGVVTRLDDLLAGEAAELPQHVPEPACGVVGVGPQAGRGQPSGHPVLADGEADDQAPRMLRKAHLATVHVADERAQYMQAPAGGA